MKKGFIAISSVLVLMVVILAVITTVVLLSVGEAQTSLSLLKGEDNLQLVEGCVEDYMLKIRSDPSFTATDITRPEGTCHVVINSANPNWDITVTADNNPAGTSNRKIQVKFVRNSTGITLTSWLEI